MFSDTEISSGRVNVKQPRFGSGCGSGILGCQECDYAAREVIEKGIVGRGIHLDSLSAGAG
jgi:hypothetical protein